MKKIKFLAELKMQILSGYEDCKDAKAVAEKYGITQSMFGLGNPFKIVVI